MMIKLKTLLNLLFILSVSMVGFAQKNEKSYLLPPSSIRLKLPHQFFNEPLLLINRIVGYPNKLYHYGASGMDVDYSVVLRFEPIENNQIRVRQLQYQNQTASDDIIRTSVMNNHFDPVICYISIIEKSKEGILIDWSQFERNVELFSPVGKSIIQKYGLVASNDKAILLNSIQLKENGFQIKRTCNYRGDKKPEGHYSNYLSVEQLLTFRRLSKQPMAARKWDQRVGNFYLDRKLFSSNNCLIEKESYIERWRLEPTDTAAYFRGELTSPKQPIVFYMDDNVPHKWRKYIKQGILDWLPVFENIGFKNAIQVYDKPTNAKWDDGDPDYNMIRWVSSEIKDAQGNYVSDPRSGEILNGTLTWYQNFFYSILEEYFVKAAAVDIRARQPIFSDELFGEIMRKIMTHEMGHVLGLGHNMIASSAYPTDSLRSETFVAKYSISPSIMDYASYNYVAQPKDMPIGLINDISVYDYWAIEQAYRYVRPSDSSSELEVAFNNQMVNQKLKQPSLNYMEQEYAEVIDPTNLTGDLGDDPILTGRYGLENLKRIVPHIVKWSMGEDGDPAILLSRYNEIVKQCDIIFKDVIYRIGGAKTRFSNSEYIMKTADSECFESAIEFVENHLFSNMEWLYNSEVDRIANKHLYEQSVEKLQTYGVKRLLYLNRLKRMVDRDLRNDRSNTITLLRKMTHLIFKNKDECAIPLAVKGVYVKRVQYLIEESNDNIILNHLLKKELAYMFKLIKENERIEKNPLKKCFYAGLRE